MRESGYGREIFRGKERRENRACERGRDGERERENQRDWKGSKIYEMNIQYCNKHCLSMHLCLFS